MAAGARSPHLTRRAEFLRVASRGRKAPSPGLVLQAMQRDDALPVRLGFTVTKKVGNAVVRNRTRRRLREAARLLLAEVPANRRRPGAGRPRHHAGPAVHAADRRPAARPGQAGRDCGAMTPVATALALAVRAYQLVLRPLLPPACRFEPSCSVYAIEALRVHGAARGGSLAAWRVLRCNPWCACGFDPVQGKAFFFEKKQKAFIRFAPAFPRTRAREQKFFGPFSKKRDCLPS